MEKIAGIVWYKTERNYINACRIFADAFNMPNTYMDWLIQVKKRAKEVQRDGWVLVRAELDPETFPDWCKARGLNVDSKARSLFGNEAASEYLKNGTGQLLEL